MALFTGCAVSLITPFRNGAIDEDALARLTELQIASKISAICILDNAGEARSLSEDEKLFITQFIVERVNGRVPVIACAYAADTSSVIEYARSAQAIGADAIMVTTPYFGALSQEAIRSHFEMIFDELEIPVFLKNDPVSTGNNISSETLAAFVQNYKPAGIVDCSGKTINTIDFISVASGIDLFAGNEQDIIPAVSLGAAGVFSSAANIVPEIIQELFETADSGKFNVARALLFQLQPLLKALDLGVSPAAIKTMLEIVKLCSGEMRIPLIPLNKEQLSTVTDVLKGYEMI